MKRIFSIILASIMLVSVFAFPTSAAAELVYDFNTAEGAAAVEFFGNGCSLRTEDAFGPSDVKLIWLENKVNGEDATAENGLYTNGVKIKFTSEFTGKATVKMAIAFPDYVNGARGYQLYAKVNDGAYVTKDLNVQKNTKADYTIDVNVVAGANELYLVHGVKIDGVDKGNGWRIDIYTAEIDLPNENQGVTPDEPEAEDPSLIRPVDGANYKVDMEEIADTGVNAAHGYPDQNTKLYGYGSWLDLGKYDLSAFSAVEITYATTNGYDADAGIDEPAFFCLMDSSAGIGNPQTGMTNEDKIIGGKGVLSDGEITNPTGINWDKNERETTIDLTGVDYKGPVFLHHFNSFGNEALVVGIKFIAADGADTPDTPDTPDTTPDTPATNPETGDMAVVVIAAVAALALAGVVVCKKVRA